MASQPHTLTGRERLRVRVSGAVQGVGFRPFVHNLATRNNLSGFVLNDADGVLLEVEGGDPGALVNALKCEPPPLARIDRMDIAALPPDGGTGFEIRASEAGTSRTRMVPDAATCEACLDDLFDPTSRFFRYPFVTCTQCGPRFTIIRGLPYDRARTSMAGFPLCEACLRDYRDPASRRFHAEAIACAVCGPRLSHPIAKVADALRAGQIVALKGIGGFHLMCDARNEAAVVELRRRKRRAEKPFAIMVANQASAGLVAAPERDLLARRSRPIVLLSQPDGLAPSIAHGLNRIGVMLAYAPVHHLLFERLAEGSFSRSQPVSAALVATSANPGGEPLAIDDADAHRRLAGIADLIVTHDRPILARADDPVMAVIDKAPVYFRRGRGCVPEPIDLGFDGPPVLGVGGYLKTTLTITRGREAFMSQHVGDLNTTETIRFHEEIARHLLDVLDISPDAIACDLHPDFPSTRFAESLGLPVLRVQHHATHLAAVVAEHRLAGPVLGIALDGHGVGDDGGAWGGELMRLDGERWSRVGHLLPLALPGGDRAARETWRMGVAALIALDRGGEAARLFPDIVQAGRLAALLAGPAAVPVTTSMGRLFDAAAALLGTSTRQSHEGQAAMALEALVREPRVMPGGWRLAEGVLDFRPLLGALIALRGDLRLGADMFHGTLIDGLSAWVADAASRLGLRRVMLGGGCFMNRILAEGLMDSLRALGHEPFLPRAVPANDGGLSLGQVALARIALMNHDGGGFQRAKDRPCVSQFPFL